MMRTVCNDNVLKQNINNSPYDNLNRFTFALPLRILDNNNILVRYIYFIICIFLVL